MLIRVCHYAHFDDKVSSQDTDAATVVNYLELALRAFQPRQVYYEIVSVESKNISIGKGIPKCSHYLVELNMRLRSLHV